MIPFFKYQGTGNDFVMIDNRHQTYLTKKDVKAIERLCDRKFGIGADGLILLQSHSDYDFEMIYFNADGRESTMCGNGGRCIVAFAKQLGIISDKAHFIAIDGEHRATIDAENWVSLEMIDVADIEQGDNFFVLNTGSPHYVQFVEDVEKIDVFNAGRAIRYNERFNAEGINVNFVEQTSNGLRVVTYERGVEDETLSCGTGVTASAIAYQALNAHRGKADVPVRTKGGNLAVRLHYTGDRANQIWLSGSATLVFGGQIKL